jgi:uncharacterized membrane protein
MIHPPIYIQVTIAGAIGGVAILNAAVLWFMPRLTRPDLYFAVTVSPGFRDEAEGKSILRGYRIELIIASVLALAAFVAGVIWLGIGFVPFGFWMHVLAGFVVFYRARGRTLPYALPPTMIREAELHGKHDRVIPGGRVAAAGPFVLLAICATFLWIHGIEAPVRLSNHWTINGQPADFQSHTLLIYLLTTSGILIWLTLVLYGLARWVRPVYASGPERARELKFRRTTAAIVLVAEYYAVLQASWVLFVRSNHGLLRVVTFPLAFIFVLVVLVVLARLGQGGSRLRGLKQKSSAVSATPVGDRTPDRYWKLGVFYFNPDDSAIFVEKRFGLGYSLNFGRPITWFILALILMAPLIPIVAHFSRFLARFGA